MLGGAAGGRPAAGSAGAAGKGPQPPPSRSSKVVTTPAPPGTAEELISVPLLGKVPVYRPEPIQKARGVVLFVSGDGGWELGVVDMARRIAPRGIVVGISMPAWQKLAEKNPGACWYPAAELESIAQAAEKTLRLPRYLAPILVGYSSGATVVYGALAQAPDTTFAGAVSLGFCPDLEVARPLCARGSWKPSWDPKKRLSLLPPRGDLAPAARPGAMRWTALQGDVDQVCDPKSTGAFVAKVPQARLVALPGVGHGFSVPRHWGEAFDGAVGSLMESVGAWEPEARPEGRESDAGAAGPASDARAAGEPSAPASPERIRRRLEALGLPLVIEWPEAAKEAVVFVSGDGGWADIDRQVASRLAARGIAVVGWNTLRYFWQARTPGEFRADLARLVEAIPGSVRVFAGGYSFGAEVVPVTLASRLPDRPAPLSRIAGQVLLAPGSWASFEVSPLDWLRSDAGPSAWSVREALASAGEQPVLCIEPAGEEDSGCAGGRGAGLVRAPARGRASLRRGLRRAGRQDPRFHEDSAPRAMTTGRVLRRIVAVAIIPLPAHRVRDGRGQGQAEAGTRGAPRLSWPIGPSPARFSPVTR